MLTPEQITKTAAPYFGTYGFKVEPFARAIEAEVRKDDEALIRKMLDYLEEMQDEGPTGEGWKSDDLMSVISAATARLEKEGRQHG